MTEMWGRIRASSWVVMTSLSLLLLVMGPAGLASAQALRTNKIGQSRLEEERASPGETQILLDELYDLRRQVSSLKGASSSEAEGAAEVLDRIDQLEARVRAAESQYRESLMESNERFTSESLALTGTWINWVAILFGVVIALIGVGNFLGARQSKKELERDRKDIKEVLEGEKRQIEQIRLDLTRAVGEALVTMNAVRERSGQEMSAFKVEVQEQRVSSERTRVFVQAVAERFFSDTLLELLTALHKGGVLGDIADKDLRNKTREVEARIFLRYPDSNRAEQAIRTLMALGSEAALPDLSAFASEIATDTDLKTLAHQAMIRISERRGASMASG